MVGPIHRSMQELHDPWPWKWDNFYFRNDGTSCRGVAHDFDPNEHLMRELTDEEVEGYFNGQMPRRVSKSAVQRVEVMADWHRAGGDVKCTHCDQSYYDHPQYPGYGWLRMICNGDLVKL